MTMARILEYGHGVWALHFLCFTLFYAVLAQDVKIETVDVRVHNHEYGGISNITCQVSPATAEIKWIFKEEIINSTNGKIVITKSLHKDEDGTQYMESLLTIIKTNKANTGDYICEAKLGNVTHKEKVTLDVTFPAEFIPTNVTYYVNATQEDKENSVKMECVFKTYNIPENVVWQRIGDDSTYSRNFTVINETHIQSILAINKVVPHQNGTYECKLNDTVSGVVIGKVDLIVYGDPKILIDSVIGINRTELYFNWTVDPFNSEIDKYEVSFATPPEGFVYFFTRPEKNATSFVLTNLKPSTEYTVKVTVHTKHGSATSKVKSGKTLDVEPNFVPVIDIKGFSATSVTIDWASPPEDIANLIHYYLLEAKKKDGGTPRKAYHSRDSRNLPYMFDNLEPHSTYIFKVRACQDYTKKCWDWSDEMEAATLDGTPGKPSDPRANCSATQMDLTWGPPIKPNAEIKGYMMELTGVREYKENKNKIKKETWGPLSRFMSNESRTARFEELFPNAIYTVKLSAVTRTRRRGEEEIAVCHTQVAAPDRKPGAKWSKFFDKESNKYLFQTQLTKVPERNGPLCCYRVHVVRLPPKYDMKDLMKFPQELDVIEYEEAHSVQPMLGSYITDIFTNDDFPDNGILTLVIGDGKRLYNESNPILKNETCQRCLLRPERQHIVVHHTTTTAKVVTTTDVDDFYTTADPEEAKRDRRKRNADNTSGGNKEYVNPKDGPLDSEANYTFFVELIPATESIEPMYSEYQNILRPAPSPIASTPASILEIALQATCAVAALLLLLMIIFCVMQSRRSRKLPPHAQLEMNPMNPLQTAIHYVRKQLSGGSQRVPLITPPDMPPIATEDLAAAYAERHADSDYGFQKEFELLQMLSESFPDRSTHASEARENQPKNRYPDIKAFDQTRVKLSQIDGITGSDYINANYVRGYKEPKKFICAQGPTDTTVNDFWRMIWEHGLELIVMLTNLEEYSKVKCSKYWPDEVRGSRAFGNITVQHVTEKRYSDYIVRELKISKQPTTVDGQPIVENNGIAKRNGDIKEPSESAPTSPRESKDTGETRIVKQYHFLMWKDFAAPEHPHSILKFIKRVNEAWNNMVGRPVVVHCSAGVGRTGTLVALDCLLEQLRATGHVTVFNTIAELRRQRNFLVQSQKQYVFVYRALVEYAHYGDTEIPASKLKNSIDRLRNMPEGADKCLMEHEFEKMIDSPVVEVMKSCAAGQAEEVRSRNRNQECLPYDRNRVMLTPIPGRDYSTYINASFVEAYDNSEGFIITQDPLPTTIFDFWRMVSEQGVATIVMLSELGEGNKCPRYWDDGTVQYEHISVQYDESESCPYYSRRQFRVTNNKTGHVHSVRQLQYHGWPTAPGHVPEVTRGLAELADAAAPQAAAGEHVQPMVVHCNTGTERSALFVALCVLIAQLRAERRVDVSTVARKVRSQRDKTIDTFLQYEFLHRAILNYAELHNLLEDS
ncbi:tyrosine-protein phosphatase 69D-like isoform X2 [Hyposmocoma kahamanoa]|uniref:tyrosine-protein phosphatase 69D-like isoform X2 n=1 Tax=Hyposmocoma kahamanoa TaxID=1477025 RepID=UPI000E6D7F18|nr:tyrosine-protein phosphatase 69D-like isoform X2 [Hyposmocoma kahamanoa]